MQATETPFENKIYLSIYNQEFYYLLRFISSKYLIYFRYTFSTEINQVLATFFCSEHKGEFSWVSTTTPVMSGVLLQLPQIGTPKSACFIFCSMHSLWKMHWNRKPLSYSWTKIVTNILKFSFILLLIYHIFCQI